MYQHPLHAIQFNMHLIQLDAHFINTRSPTPNSDWRLYILTPIRPGAITPDSCDSIQILN